MIIAPFRFWIASFPLVAVITVSVTMPAVRMTAVSSGSSAPAVGGEIFSPPHHPRVWVRLSGPPPRVAPPSPPPPVSGVVPPRPPPPPPAGPPPGGWGGGEKFPPPTTGAL